MQPLSRTVHHALALLVAAALAGLAAPPAPAQAIDLGGGKNGFVWSGDCSTAVSFTNKTGLSLCDLWLEIENDGAPETVELGRILVRDASGLQSWNVDDNEDGDDNDGAIESDAVDSTPKGDPQGRHRAQAGLNGECIPPGATFSIQLCDENGGSLEGQVIYLWATTRSADPTKQGGDGGVKIAEPPKKLSYDEPSTKVHIENAHLGPLDSLDFAFEVQHVQPQALFQRLQAKPPFQGLSMSFDGPGVQYNPSTQEIFLNPPLQPNVSQPLYMTISGLDPQNPITEIELVSLDTPPVTYCTAKLSSQGCLPAMGWSGDPSATSPAPFVLSCAQVEEQKNGLLFYGLQPSSAPFQGGTLCVKPPITRTPVQNSGGSGQPCSGSLAMDFNAHIQGGTDPRLVPGEEVFSQWWFRDPQSPSSTGLSDGAHFVIHP